MPDLAPAIEVYPVHHLPIIQAYADQLGLVGLINPVLPTGMLDFSFCIYYIGHLISTDVLALDGGGHHDVSTAQSTQTPAGSLPEPTPSEGVA